MGRIFLIENKKRMWIMTSIAVIITLLVVIGSLLVYLYVNGYFDGEQDPHGGMKITEKVTKKKEKTTTTTTHEANVFSTTTTTTTKPYSKYQICDDATTYPNALNEWEWAIVNLINAYREKKGLDDLLVGTELRLLAEQIADNKDDYYINKSGVKYITYSDKNIGYSTGYKELYNYAIEQVRFGELKKIKWLGVGVIYKDNTHYFCLIYE